MYSFRRLASVILSTLLLSRFTGAQTISTTSSVPVPSSTVSISSSVPAPSVAAGYSAELLASGLTTPRGILFDTSGNLLVVESGAGVVALSFTNASNGRLIWSGTKTVVNDSSLNHGIELSPDGATLYASSTESVYSYAYDSASMSVTSNATTLVSGMLTSDHTTRTLLLSKQVPGMLIVTRGSTSNIDPLAEDITTGHSQIKAFNLNNFTGTAYDFDTSGLLLGWGLRNDVGIAEEPNTGGLYSVENGVDEMMRQGVDIHATNPAEELNYLGMLRENTSPNQGSNFGYPQCYTAWDTSVIPDNNGLQVGMQFAIGTLNGTNNDTFCQQERTAARLGFEAHMAPLDIVFNDAATEAWVSFHGSWDRSPLTPSGYKVSAVPFRNGEPIANSTSNSGYVDIVANENNNNCPDQCFRPVGLAWDRLGRLFFSSDATGEIYVVTKDGSTNGTVMSATPTVNPSASVAMPTSSSTSSGAAIGTADHALGLWALVISVVLYQA